MRPVASAGNNFPQSQRESGMIKVFPLGQASLLFKKEKTLVHIRLRYIIEIHSRHCFFWSNSWNLFFFFLIILICLIFSFLWWRKKTVQMAKKYTPFMSISVPSMQCNVLHMLFLVGSLRNAQFDKLYLKRCSHTCMHFVVVSYIVPIFIVKIAYIS